MKCESITWKFTIQYLCIKALTMSFIPYKNPTKFKQRMG